MWAALRDNVVNGVFSVNGVGSPVSGTFASSGYGVCGFGSLYTDTTNGNVFINEGTTTNTYWTPISYDQRGLMGWYTDFRDGIGKALADTAATVTLAGNGLRVFGSEVVATDSGLVITMGKAGSVGSLSSSATSTFGVALGFGLGGAPTSLFEPDTNATFVMDCWTAQHTAVTARQCFIGFCSALIDAMIAPASGATTVISLTATRGADCVGFYASSALTDAFVNWFGISDAAAATATLSTATTAALTVPTLVSAVEVYQRFRVEVDANGGSRLFINKLLVKTFPAATNTVTTALSPVIVLAGTTTTVATMLVKQFGAWGVRV